jgi:hypothetical protein
MRTQKNASECRVLSVTLGLIFTTSAFGAEPKPAEEVLVGIDNALDERPPFAVGNGDDDLYGYVQSQHNPRGRFWNAKAIYRF